MMDIAIVAGGLGTRLAPVTQTVPKALVEINGEPFIAHQLRLLRSKGIERVVLCVSYLGEMIQDFVGDGRNYGLSIRYVFDGEILRGTAGAIHNALPLLGEQFFVLYGDSYLPCDYNAIARAFVESGKLGLMTVFRNEGLWDASNVEFANSNILKYDKKNRSSAMQHIDYGLGVFRREAFTDAGGDLAALYQGLISRGQLAAFEVKERFYEIGSFSGVADLSAALARGLEIR